MINEFHPDDYDWKHVFAYGPTAGQGFYKHPYAIDTYDVAQTLAAANGDNDGPDWVGVFQLFSGDYLTIRAGCDYTGWGCQESGNSELFSSLEDAIRYGLSDEERERLGFDVPA